ncbi:MAG: DUF4234 domain-containing protein [Acidobacteriota bacterium]|nr:DUF4234 domain-containing protein [Acidobacteriota bacterium]MDE3264624.1 DUF4234 domain-containing protein [Acidobacteriota bacterium]
MKPTFGDFIVWCLLGLITLGVYWLFWSWSRIESLHTAALKYLNPRS